MDINHILVLLSDHLWTWIVLPVVFLCGLFFTIKTGVVQAILLPNMLKVLRDPTPRKPDGTTQSVSAFQAFTISAASRVGVGNIAGVGTALMVGGPGSIFWMWVMAFISAGSGFIESTLGQVYKIRDKNGFRGGPSYYITNGLKSKWAGSLFALLLILCFPFAFSSLQANTIAISLVQATETNDAALMNIIVGTALSALTALVVFGGIRRIASVTQMLVPIMAISYLLIGIVITAFHIQQIPNIVYHIVADAFGASQAAGGLIGTIILTGVKRGMFSNEAGLGSAPNAGASAAVTHPVKQGLVQTLGVYFDTFIICSITAIIILVTNQDLSQAQAGIELSFLAITGTLGGWSGWLLTAIIFCLAFSSILGNYYYGETNLEFLSESPKLLGIYRVLVVGAVLTGSILSVDLVWNTADLLMGAMALTNLIAILLLSKVAFALLKHYKAQMKQGIDPVFTRKDLDIDGINCWEDHLSVTGSIPVIKTNPQDSDKNS